MELVELIRVRRALTWYGGIGAAVVLVALLFANSPSVIINVGDHRALGVPLSVLLGIAMLFTASLASWIGLSLNLENATREFAWTRPISRTMLAVRFIAVDLGGLAAGYAFTVLALWALVAGAGHGAVVFDPSVPVALVLSSGVVAMWYALLLLASAPFNGRGGSIAGMLWAASLILISVGQGTRSGPLHTAAQALNVINPFAYLSLMVHIDGSGDGPFPSVWALDPTLRAAIVWALSAVFCAAAIALWKRREI
jgi:hypothetical protein